MIIYKCYTKKEFDFIQIHYLNKNYHWIGTRDLFFDIVHDFNIKPVGLLIQVHIKELSVVRDTDIYNKSLITEAKTFIRQLKLNKIT